MESLDPRFGVKLGPLGWLTLFLSKLLGARGRAGGRTPCFPSAPKLDLFGFLVAKVYLCTGMNGSWEVIVVKEVYL